MGEDRLVEIPRSDWEEWRDLYKQDWPRHEIAYNLVQNYFNWSKHDRKIKDLVLYSLNGSWRKNGTFVIIDRIDLYMYTLEESLVTLRRALELVDWDYYYIVVMCEYPALLLDTFNKLDVRVACSHLNTNYFLAKEEALKLTVTVPEGFRLGPLEPEHTKIVCDHWPHRELASIFYVERLIRWNPSMGLFDEQGTLLGWCLFTPAGVLANLGVVELRKGYGKIVVSAFAKKLAEMGHNLYASIFEKNKPSQALFEGLGFKPIKEVNWIRNCERKLVEWSSERYLAVARP